MCRLCYWHMTRDDRFTWIRQYFNCCAADSQTDEEGASKQTNQNPSEAIVSAYDRHRIFGKFLLIVRDLEANWIHQCGISSHFRYCVRAIDITYLASSFEKTDNPRLFILTPSSRRFIFLLAGTIMSVRFKWTVAAVSICPEHLFTSLYQPINRTSWRI